MVQRTGSSSEGYQPLTDLDLSSFKNSILLPAEVRRQAESMITLIESLVKLHADKQTAFMEATDAIQLATKHVIESAKLQEEQLLSDLWIRHERTFTPLSEYENQVSERVQAILRLMDNADAPAMEWSLPSRSENTEIIINRLDDLEKQIKKIQAECSVLVSYSPRVSNPTLGTVGTCAVSQYKSPIVPGVASNLYESNSPRESNSMDFQLSIPSHLTENAAGSYTDSSEPERSLSPVPAPRKRKIHRSLSVHARRTMPLILQQQNQSMQTNVTPQLMYKLDLIGSKPGELKQPTDAVILPNGNVLVADYNNKRLQEFDRYGQSVQMFNYPRIKPKAVTLTRDNFIAIIDGIDKNIKTYTRGAELVCRFGTGYFRDPWAIATNLSDHYVLIDTHSELIKTVFIYDPMTSTKTVLGFVNGDYIFSNPEGVAVTRDDHILVTDAGHHCVFLFDNKGKYVSRIGQEGQSPGEFWYPKGICVDRFNNFLVADCGNHRISLFSQSGKYLCNIVDRHHGLHFPLNICISHQDVLVVVQNAEVHVFHVPRSQPLKPEAGPLSTTRSLPQFASALATESEKLDNNEVESNERRTAENRPSRTLWRNRSKSISSLVDLGKPDLGRSSSMGLSVLKRSSRVVSSDDDMDNALEEGMLI